MGGSSSIGPSLRFSATSLLTSAMLHSVLGSYLVTGRATPISAPGGTRFFHEQTARPFSHG
jgi:hypothetical protein